MATPHAVKHDARGRTVRVAGSSSPPPLCAPKAGEQLAGAGAPYSSFASYLWHQSLEHYAEIAQNGAMLSRMTRIIILSRRWKNISLVVLNG